MDANKTPSPLIRTGIRHKLPRGLSHPIGAEAISRALAGCPRYDELWIAFGAKPLPIFQAPAECADFRLAFSVGCHNYFDSWDLSVPAVPSKERNVIHQLLLAFGLPGVREWLCRSRPETWYEGFRSFAVGSAIEPLRVCFVESLNHRVVGLAIVEGQGIAPI